MLFDFIEFENRRFVVRTLDLGEEFGICSIASESLNDLLLKNGGSYASHEAELVDERIFFFIGETKLALPDKKLKEAVLGQIR
jgi:hypothetical protein